MTMMKLGEHPREFALHDGRNAEISPLTLDIVRNRSARLCTPTVVQPFIATLKSAIALM
jgi:hypothetical protein